MKRLLLSIMWILTLTMCASCQQTTPSQIAATTLPVYEFTAVLCEGTHITVTRLITEEVSCLHDYSLQTRQMRAIEGAQLLVISGGGLEDFLEDALDSANNVIDASNQISLHCSHVEDESDHKDHHHENDPHFWLSPANAKIMVSNICQGLILQFPEHEETFLANETALLARLNELHNYGQMQLSNLSHRDIITFHDGFAYLAEAYDLNIVKAIEEESGSEASAAELIDIITLVNKNNIAAIFTERSGSSSAADIIAAETSTAIYQLDMAMAGDSYFDAMYHNIDTLQEALG